MFSSETSSQILSKDKRSTASKLIGLLEEARELIGGEPLELPERPGSQGFCLFFNAGRPAGDASDNERVIRSPRPIGVFLGGMGAQNQRGKGAARREAAPIIQRGKRANAPRSGGIFENPRFQRGSWTPTFGKSLRKNTNATFSNLVQFLNGAALCGS